MVQGVNHEVKFHNLIDFRRILSDDNYEQVLSTPTLEIYTPTKESLKGDDTFLYIVADEKLLNATNYYLVGKAN